MTKALLADNVKSLREQLFRVLDIIIRFCALQDQLIGDAHAEATRRRTMSKFYSHSSSTTIEGVSRDVLDRVQTCIDEYNQNFRKLISMLKEQAGSNEKLRHLTFRLDFNEFYAKPVPTSTPEPPTQSGGPKSQTALTRPTTQARSATTAANTTSSATTASATGRETTRSAQPTVNRARSSATQRAAAVPVTPPRTSVPAEQNQQGTPAHYLPKLNDEELSSFGTLDSIHVITSTNLTSFDASDPPNTPP